MLHGALTPATQGAVMAAAGGLEHTHDLPKRDLPPHAHQTTAPSTGKWSTQGLDATMSVYLRGEATSAPQLDRVASAARWILADIARAQSELAGTPPNDPARQVAALAPAPRLVAGHTTGILDPPAPAQHPACTTALGDGLSCCHPLPADLPQAEEDTRAATGPGDPPAALGASTGPMGFAPGRSSSSSSSEGEFPASRKRPSEPEAEEQPGQVTQEQDVVPLPPQHRKRSRTASESSGHGFICPICRGPGRASMTHHCQTCYSGLYNDARKVVRACANRNEVFPITGRRSHDLSTFTYKLKTLVKQCTNSYSCGPEAWAHAMPVPDRCQRCRTLATLEMLPQVAYDIIRKVVKSGLASGDEPRRDRSRKGKARTAAQLAKQRQRQPPQPQPAPPQQQQQARQCDDGGDAQAPALQGAFMPYSMPVNAATMAALSQLWMLPQRFPQQPPPQQQPPMQAQVSHGAFEPMQAVATPGPVNSAAATAAMGVPAGFHPTTLVLPPGLSISQSLIDAAGNPLLHQQQEY